MNEPKSVGEAFGAAHIPNHLFFISNATGATYVDKPELVVPTIHALMKTNGDAEEDYTVMLIRVISPNELEAMLARGKSVIKRRVQHMVDDPLAPPQLRELLQKSDLVEAIANSIAHDVVVAALHSNFNEKDMADRMAQGAKSVGKTAAFKMYSETLSNNGRRETAVASYDNGEYKQGVAVDTTNVESPEFKF